MGKFSKVYVNRVEQPYAVEYKITNEGERAVDITKVKVIKTSLEKSSALVPYNTEVHIVQDIVSLNGLVLCVIMDNCVEDHSGKFYHGTPTNITYEKVGFNNGRFAKFDGTAFITVGDQSAFDFSGKFDIVFRIISTQATSGYFLSKTTNGTDGLDVRLNGTANKITVRILGTELVSTTSVNDGVMHIIRVSRDENNLVKLYVDSNMEDSDTIAGNATSTASIFVGKKYDGTSFYVGNGGAFRVYSGRNLSDKEHSSLINQQYVVNPLVYGGYARNTEDDIGFYVINVDSFAKIIANTEIDTLLFTNTTTKAIIQNLIETYTTMTFSDTTTSSVTMERFVADGKIVDVVQYLCKMSGYVFSTDGHQTFFLENMIVEDPALTYLTLTHGDGVIVTNDGYDDTELVNDLSIIGYNYTYQSQAEFDLDATLIYTNIDHPFINFKVIWVENYGLPSETETELVLDTDYTYNLDARTITFTDPAKEGEHFKIPYTYESPIYIKSEREDSISTYRRKSRKLTIPWLRTEADAVKFAQAYLDAFDSVSNRVKIISPSLDMRVTENLIINVVSTVLNINATYIVKSVIYDYPKNQTTVIAGEYDINVLEIQRLMHEKIHFLEAHITGSRDIRTFKHYEQAMALVDEILSLTQYTKAYYNQFNYNQDGKAYTSA